ncbi:hypothetical protein BKA57DRAFT_176614 [Linnemannia elongata]|nr:hypothetical protein BKA57DRAFT_176614 [Linnemannia elongata]
MKSSAIFLAVALILATSAFAAPKRRFSTVVATSKSTRPVITRAAVLTLVRIVRGQLRQSRTFPYVGQWLRIVLQEVLLQQELGHDPLLYSVTRSSTPGDFSQASFSLSPSLSKERNQRMISHPSFTC